MGNVRIRRMTLDVPQVVSGIGSDRALEALAHVEEQIADQLEGFAVRQRRYHRFREWLVDRPLLRALLGRTLVSGVGSIPGLDFPTSLSQRLRRALRLATSRLDPRMCVAHTGRADATVIHTNLRGFYVGGSKPLTVKVAIRPAEAASRRPMTEFHGYTKNPEGAELPESAAWLNREVESRRYAERFFHVPTLYGYDFTGPYAYLAERLVRGTRPWSSSSREMVCDVLTPRLLRLYEHHGYRFESPAEAIGGCEALVEAEAALEFLGTARPARERLMAAAERVVDSPRRMAISFAHGDLTPSNTLIDESGTVYVLDWERAGENLVARDLGFLLDTCPNRLEPVAEAAFRSQAKYIDSHEICSMREQLGVLGLRELALWREQLRKCDFGRDIEAVRRRLRFQRGLVELLRVN